MGLPGFINESLAKYLDDTVGALNIKLTDADISYLEEPYIPHKTVGAI